MNNPRLFNRLSGLATLACYTAPAVMAAADLATIALNRNFSPVQESVSKFAIQPYGWLEKLGMGLIAITFFLIAVNLLALKNEKGLRRLRLAGGFLIVVAIGFLMIMGFNTNVIGTIVSFHGLVHKISTLAVSVVFYAACLIFMTVMTNRPGYKFFGLYSGFTFLVGFIIMSLLSLGHYRHEYMGLLERTIACFNLIWIVLVGPQVIRLANSLQ